MKNYRIQLANNYQVIEFNLVLDDEEALSIDHPDVADAIEFVNALGKLVEQPAKAPAAKKAPAQKKSTIQRGRGSSKEEMASERQLDYLEGLGYSGEDGWDLTKEQANQKIRELQGK